MWQLVQANAGQEAARTAPAARSKHAVCFASDGHIYLFGGKSKHSPLKDLWRFDSGQFDFKVSLSSKTNISLICKVTVWRSAEQNYWEEIKCEGECPPCLQNHSMNAWNVRISGFGFLFDLGLA
jgi:hypothetical protein